MDILENICLILETHTYIFMGKIIMMPETTFQSNPKGGIG